MKKLLQNISPKKLPSSKKTFWKKLHWWFFSQIWSHHRDSSRNTLFERISLSKKKHCIIYHCELEHCHENKDVFMVLPGIGFNFMYSKIVQKNRHFCLETIFLVLHYLTDFWVTGSNWRNKIIFMRGFEFVSILNWLKYTIFIILLYFIDSRWTMSK